MENQNRQIPRYAIGDKATGMLRIRINARGRAGRKPILDAATIFAALQAGDSPAHLAQRFGVALSSIYRARDRALRRA